MSSSPTIRLRRKRSAGNLDNTLAGPSHPSQYAKRMHTCDAIHCRDNASLFGEEVDAMYTVFSDDDDVVDASASASANVNADTGDRDRIVHCATQISKFITTLHCLQAHGIRTLESQTAHALPPSGGRYIGTVLVTVDVSHFVITRKRPLECDARLFRTVVGISEFEWRSMFHDLDAAPDGLNQTPAFDDESAFAVTIGTVNASGREHVMRILAGISLLLNRRVFSISRKSISRDLFQVQYSVFDIGAATFAPTTETSLVWAALLCKDPQCIISPSRKCTCDNAGDTECAILFPYHTNENDEIVQESSISFRSTVPESFHPDTCDDTGLRTFARNPQTQKPLHPELDALINIIHHRETSTDPHDALLGRLYTSVVFRAGVIFSITDQIPVTDTSPVQLYYSHLADCVTTTIPDKTVVGGIISTKFARDISTAMCRLVSATASPSPSSSLLQEPWFPTVDMLDPSVRHIATTYGHKRTAVGATLIAITPESIREWRKKLWTEARDVGQNIRICEYDSSRAYMWSTGDVTDMCVLDVECAFGECVAEYSARDTSAYAIMEPHFTTADVILTLTQTIVDECADFDAWTHAIRTFAEPYIREIIATFDSNTLTNVFVALMETAVRKGLPVDTVSTQLDKIIDEVDTYAPESRVGSDSIIKTTAAYYSKHRSVHPGHMTEWQFTNRIPGSFSLYSHVAENTLQSAVMHFSSIVFAMTGRGKVSTGANCPSVETRTWNTLPPLLTRFMFRRFMVVSHADEKVVATYVPIFTEIASRSKWYVHHTRSATLPLKYQLWLANLICGRRVCDKLNILDGTRGGTSLARHVHESIVLSSKVSMPHRQLPLLDNITHTVTYPAKTGIYAEFLTTNADIALNFLKIRYENAEIGKHVDANVRRFARIFMFYLAPSVIPLCGKEFERKQIKHGVVCKTPQARFAAMFLSALTHERQVSVHSIGSFTRKFGKSAAALAREPDCLICGDPFTGVRVTGKCGHAMHFTCALDWFKTRLSHNKSTRDGGILQLPDCPLCRDKLVSYHNVVPRVKYNIGVDAVMSKLQVIDDRAEDCMVACFFHSTAEIRYFSVADYLYKFSSNDCTTTTTRRHNAMLCTQSGISLGIDTAVSIDMHHSNTKIGVGPRPRLVANVKLDRENAQDYEGIYNPCRMLQKHTANLAMLKEAYTGSRIDIIINDVKALVRTDPTKKIIIVANGFTEFTPISPWNYAVHMLSDPNVIHVAEDWGVNPCTSIFNEISLNECKRDPRHVAHMASAFHRFSVDPSVNILFLNVPDATTYVDYDLTAATDVFFVTTFVGAKILPSILSYVSNTALRTPLHCHWYATEHTSEIKSLDAIVQYRPHRTELATFGTNTDE